MNFRLEHLTGISEDMKHGVLELNLSRGDVPPVKLNPHPVIR